MLKYFLTVVVVLISQGIKPQPVPVNNNHSVIVSTDCAIDDLRSLCLLLERPEITIRAVVVSDGSISPSEGLEKVYSLLSFYNRKDIPVLTGREMKGNLPSWREFNESVSWGTGEPAFDTINSEKEALSRIISETDKPLVVLCLGPLTDIAELLVSFGNIKKQVERIIWYNQSIHPLRGFNAECDTSASLFILRSGIRTDVISDCDAPGAIFDTNLFGYCKAENTKLAQMYNMVFSQPVVHKRLIENHFRLADDLTVMYMTNPELFDMNTSRKYQGVRYNTAYDLESVKDAYMDMITGKYIQSDQIVFTRFPMEHGMYRYDIRRMMDSAISKYGFDEWKANVMTDEFHGHLGVYSIVGAKMGIRAREIFDAGPDILQVTSFAGNRPPYSCLNDGIQVSTGSTLGMGLINIVDDSIPAPSALFKFKDRTIRLTLKKEYFDRIKNDIEEGVVKYGLMDDGYWKLVRRNAIRYWLEWDRKLIFEVEEE